MWYDLQNLNPLIVIIFIQPNQVFLASIEGRNNPGSKRKQLVAVVEMGYCIKASFGQH